MPKQGGCRRLRKCAGSCVIQPLRALLPHEGGDHGGDDNPTRAVSFTEELLERYQALADTPRAYPLVPRHESFGVRRCVHGNYWIFCSLQPEQIEMIHILQGARDIEALLIAPLNHPPENFRDSQIRIRLWSLIQEGKKGLEPGSVGACRVELDSGGKHSLLMEALKAFSLAFSCLSLAFSCLSCSVSFAIRSLSFLTRKISLSICFVLSLLRSIAIRFSFIRCSCSSIC